MIWKCHASFAKKQHLKLIRGAKKHRKDQKSTSKTKKKTLRNKTKPKSTKNQTKFWYFLVWSGFVWFLIWTFDLFGTSSPLELIARRYFIQFAVCIIQNVQIPIFMVLSKSKELLLHFYRILSCGNAESRRCRKRSGISRFGEPLMFNVDQSYFLNCVDARVWVFFSPSLLFNFLLEMCVPKLIYKDFISKYLDIVE